MKAKIIFGIVVCLGLIRTEAPAQAAPANAELKGLAAVTVLLKNDTGKAALGANYVVTGGIQTGTLPWPNLLPFAEQQQQALRDVFITSGNLTQLADGLGTTLGAAYQARFHYIDRAQFTKLPPTLTNLINYALAITGSNSNAGKYFFANGTTDGQNPVSPDLAAILKELEGTTDVFGKAYNLQAMSAGADPFGNSRPYQTETHFLPFAGLDFFYSPADNSVYNRGPMMNLASSPSYPSGHTTYGYTGALLLAVLVPERYEQMIARGAEYGNDRVIVGAHYAMDVIGGRTLAFYDMAHLLANDPGYLNRSIPKITAVADFRDAVKEGRTLLASTLETGCGKAVKICSKEDTGRFSNTAANDTLYAATLNYDLPVVYSKTADTFEDIGKVAPEAGYLLTVAFPWLTLAQADRILTETEGPGGGFLDDGSAFGVYSRLNLIAAARRAEQSAPAQ